MAELFGPMKEGIAIQIQDMEPNVFKALLSFVYTDLMPEMEVEGEAEEGEGRADEVMWLQHLLAAADRYDLQRLKSMCEERLWGHIDMSSVTFYPWSSCSAPLPRAEGDLPGVPQSSVSCRLGTSHGDK